MSETQPIEQRQHGDIHALIRTIPTKHGDMRTVTLHREWLGRDGRTRYAHDLRIRDIGPAIKLLADIAKRENQEASTPEAPGPNIADVPPPAWYQIDQRQHPFPPSTGNSLASANPDTWRYHDAELACWHAIVRTVLAEPDDVVQRLLTGA